MDNFFTKYFIKKNQSVGGLEKDHSNIDRENRVKEIQQYLDGYFKRHDVHDIKMRTFTEYANYFWMFMKNNSKLKEILQQKLHKKSLVDLGTGLNPNNIPSNVDILFSKYTAVDLLEPNEVNLNKENNIYSSIDLMNKKGVDASFKIKDMLSFVTDLPDESSNFILSGIDHSAILENDYWHYFCDEIIRATEKDGIIIQGFSTDLERYIDTSKLKIIFDGGENSEKVFQKI